MKLEKNVPVQPHRRTKPSPTPRPNPNKPKPGPKTVPVKPHRRQKPKQAAIHLFLLLFSLSIWSCAHSQFYTHVYTNSADLLKEASLESKVIKTLPKYTNLQVLDTLNTDWLRVQIEGAKGFVKQEYLKEGRVEVKNIRGARIGAVCKDGTSSSATGRGACSHHGGVRHWRYETRQTIEIIPNQ